MPSRDEFDDSGMTPMVAAAFQRALARVPPYQQLRPLKAVRVNPALRAAKLDGQYLDDGVIEVNPDVTDPIKLEELLLHEMAHGGGMDEQASQIAERIPTGAGFLINSRGQQRSDQARLREALLAKFGAK